jgi:class 3 adenylate cyclase/tetratricopeptide (TPR) repeat protein
MRTSTPSKAITAVVWYCRQTNEVHDRSRRRIVAASQLAPGAGASPGARKVVTVLFSDVVGSTKLGDALDPESLRSVMTRYFEGMRAVIGHHGGVVEKFIGDAIMAVFGAPRAHEDDAHRAVRAAIEMRDALRSLDEEFGRWGVRIQTRTGVNTGEVITGDPETGGTFVTGDAVNVAARLEEAAEEGEILLSDTTYRLARDVALAEPLEPLTMKGKADPVAAWRLLGILPDTSPRTLLRVDSPLAGRQAELAELRAAFARAVGSRSCEVVTVLGTAGVGKSRLAAEFVSSLTDDVRVVRGRCLPYGEGITFAPIVGVMREGAEINDTDSPEQARQKLEELLHAAPDSALIRQRLTGLLGISDVTPGMEETFWGVRKLLEELARRRTLVVVFEDIHWGEPTFLDLLEYLADWLHSVPALLVCLARPELLETRGEWLTGKTNAIVVKVEPLSRAETERLIQGLVGEAPLAEGAIASIADVAEGNPLFVEETLRMLIDEGWLQRRNGNWSVGADLSTLKIPPTIHSLLSARMDMLDAGERAVIERASVVGRVFWWAAVSELFPVEDRGHLAGWLHSLVRKELVRPERSDPMGEDAYRFLHILVRDAAYAGIPKARRADLHERFAQWLDAKSRDRAGEYEEIVGYHLEQAYQMLRELEPAGERTQAMGLRAAPLLASAGKRAFARGDMPAAGNLLSRAVSLLPPGDRARTVLLPDLAFALMQTGDFGKTRETLTDLKHAAEASSDVLLGTHALLLDLWTRLFTDPEGWPEEAFREATRAISVFEDRDDVRGVAQGWAVLGLSHMLAGRFASAVEAWEEAAAHASAANARREELEHLTWVPVGLWSGPTPLDEAVDRCREILDRVHGDRKATAVALAVWGNLEAMGGRFDEARELAARAKSLLQEIALPAWMGALTQMSGWTEILAGEPAAAERDLRWGVETLRAIGELNWLSTTAAMLSEALCAQGRMDEAEEFLKVSQEAAGSEDIFSQVLWRTVRAKIMAQLNGVDDAERIARDAVEIARSSDSLLLQAEAFTTLAQVMSAAGRSTEANEALTEAMRACEQKGYLAGRLRAQSSWQASRSRT